MFLNPLGLLALIGVPAVVALHLYRRRFRPRVVSAIFLWADQDRSPVAGRRREPLHRSASFWFELLAALVLALSIAGLRFTGAGRSAHAVFVLDGSASMSAAGERSDVAQEVRERVQRRIDALPRGSRVTLIESGVRPTLLAGPVAFPREARSALAAYAPRRGRHDLNRSVALARELAAGGRVSLFTDRFQPENWPEDLDLVAVGQPRPNLAWVNGRREPVREEDSGRWGETLSATLQNFSPAPARLRVELRVADEHLTEREVELAPRGRRTLTFRLPPDTPELTLHLPGDALAADNLLRLAPSAPRTLRLASNLPRALCQHLGLARPGEGSARLDRLCAMLPQCVEVKDPGAAHLVFTRGALPGQAWNVVFAPPTDEAQHLVGPFLLDRTHPLLSGVTLDGVVWSAPPELELAGAPLISAGNLPLLTEGRDGARALFLFGLLPEQSSLHRSPDWPILLTNLAELRRSELPGPARVNLTSDMPLIYRDHMPASYRLDGPQGAREVAARGVLTLDGLDIPGSYSLTRLPPEEPAEGEPAASEEHLADFAVSFIDAAESDLLSASSGERPSAAADDSLSAGFGWTEIVLLVLVLTLVGLDWFVLDPRRKRNRELAS